MTDKNLTAMNARNVRFYLGAPLMWVAVMVCAIRTMLCGAEYLQRPVDGRLLKMEEKGVEGCGLFGGAVHRVASAAEVRALAGKLKPGDQLVLVGEEWKDARFTFNGAGTEEAPILIRPEKSGGAVFTGKSEVIFHGSHLVVQGLTFRGVNPAREGAVILRAGDGEAKPADHCIFTGLTFDHCGSTEAADWPRQKLWLMSLRGSDNTVAGCRFAGLKHIGQMIGAAELPKTGLQRLHVLNNRFTDRPKIDEQNGYEILQIGWSGESAKGAGSLIEGNTFENCDGENEIISLKASDVLVRGNFFFGCQGVLSLRSANRVRVEGNVFDGKGKANTGGITAEGADHVISGNTFRNLKAPKDYYFWTLAFLSASAENIGDNGDVAGYGRAKNILISHNRFEHCDARIAVGAYPRKEYPLLPRDLRVEDNVFVGMKGPSVFDYLAPDPEGEVRKTWREVRNVFER